MSVSDVEKLKLENKKMRLELQNMRNIVQYDYES